MPLPYRKNPAPSPSPLLDTPLAQQLFFLPTNHRPRSREREQHLADVARLVYLFPLSLLLLFFSAIYYTLPPPSHPLPSLPGAGALFTTYLLYTPNLLLPPTHHRLFSRLMKILFRWNSFLISYSSSFFFLRRRRRRWEAGSSVPLRNHFIFSSLDGPCLARCRMI